VTKDTEGLEEIERINQYYVNKNMYWELDSILF
jgi:hypothetical protein